MERVQSLSIVAPSSTALDVIASSDAGIFDTSWQLGAQSWSTTAPVPVCCHSLTMSVAPSSVSIPANGSVSVHLSTTMINDANTINLSYTVPQNEGIAAGQFAPTSVMPGQGVDIGFAAQLGTPPGPKGPITITGNNGIETHSVVINVTTTACAPTNCQALGSQCGSIDDMCGHILPCGMCGTGLVCVLGQCLPSRCAHPRSCPRGSHWDASECTCVAD
ncbi:MAG: hypothetical protein JO122_15570 [Acetobacteraceae bacterium]|nr:hypothetical protein [Acetobacteraceae bacterium]